MSGNILERLSHLRLLGASQAYLEQGQLPLYQEMSFDDRLSLLLDREETMRHDRGVALRVSKARFKQPASFEDLKPQPSRGLDKTLLQNLGTCDWVRKKYTLIITGPSGSGKSFLATALSNRACVLGWSAQYLRSSALLQSLNEAQEEGSLHKTISKLGKVGVLVIDDFLLTSLDATEQNHLFELIEERHQSCPLILTSQNPISLWRNCSL